MDVGGWLRGLGLGQYEEQFRDNKIDADLLPRLTVDDLKDIGVSVVGDRRRLLDAIAVIAGAGPASPTKSGPSKGLQSSAERRPITVMFCDLAGSTSLAAKLDAEDWRNLVNAYLDEASAAVTGLGGHVLKKLGDGLMALFGYPHAQENDAERAVRAALAIQRALGELNERNVARGAPELAARIGIECGSVVVDAAGEVFGEAPNVAARVQAAAEPGSVLITLNVQRQVAGLFVAEDKGAHDLKGVTAPVALYRVVRASGGGRRGAGRALTPLVGREDELALLTRRWSRALEGEGQFVQIVGEPGIGKSRLIEEFRAKLAETPHTWVEWAASQLLQNTPLHPLAEWGRQRFGGADATDEGRLADLENTLRLVGLDPDEYAPLIAPLVDIALPDERSAKFAPEELRRRQLAAVTAWYFAGARTQPAVVVFEDLHWADPTSLDLLRSLAERGSQAPLLIVATTRPEFRPPWAMRSHHGVVSLAPLDRAQVRRMVGEIASRHALSDEMIDGVGERTGGVPLFVEEVTRLLLERDVQGGAQAIPPTLQQSLAARLDRLGSAREVAQIGAVLGRDFAYRLVRDVAEIDEPALQASLDRLADADLLFVEGAPPQANYRFKHALIQDAAYESLLKSRRQALHRRAGEALVAADAEPEAVAHHFTEAGLDDLAIEWWGKAGDQALRRSAFQEAIAHLGKAISMADKEEEASGAPIAADRRLKLQTNYGRAVMWSKGFVADETKAAFGRAAELASQTGSSAERSAVFHALWVRSFMRGEMSSARASAESFLRQAETDGLKTEDAVAHQALGLTCLFLGELALAQSHLEEVLADHLAQRDTDARSMFGNTITVIGATAFLALAAWVSGGIGRARHLIEQAVRRAHESDHIATIAQIYLFRAILEACRGDAGATLRAAEALLRVGKEHNMSLHSTYGEIFASWARGCAFDAEGGVSELLQRLGLYLAQGYKTAAPLFHGMLAELEAMTGRFDDALASVEAGLGLAKETGERWTDPLLFRCKGGILLQRDPANPTPAEEAFRAAIAVALQQGCRSFGLRAALSLAKLYHSTGRPSDAHAVLAPALEGFAPTNEMPEITEAQALLAALEEMGEVKSEVARRRGKTQLHAAYGNAMILAHGYGARETSAAFERARDTATAEDGFERLSAQYGLWAGSFVRSELGAMRELSAAMLRDCERRPQSGEASIAHRMRGVTHWFAGEFAASCGHLEQATAIFDPERDGDLAFRFGQDPGVVATAYLAEVLWLLGEVGLADHRMTETTARAAKSRHAATSAYGFFMATQFELIRRNPDRAATFARSLIKIANEHQLPFWVAYSAWFDGWLEWRSGDRKPGLAAMRNSLARQAEQSIGTATTFFETLLAEAEAEAGESDVAFCTINRALAASERTGGHWYDVETHRIRGEILLRRNSADTLTAEEAFQRAIAVAGEQGARSFQLRAALSLAKLYQSTNRLVEAQAVLSPALEGFSPTPEMPEIAQAQALLGAIEASAQVRRQ